MTWTLLPPRDESKPDCSVGTSALDQPIVLDVKDLERGEQAEILGSEEEIHSKEIEGFPSQEEVDEKGSTKHGVKELAATESVPGDELKDELKASPTLEPEASLEQPSSYFSSFTTTRQAVASQSKEGHRQSWLVRGNQAASPGVADGLLEQVVCVMSS